MSLQQWFDSEAGDGDLVGASLAVLDRGVLETATLGVTSLRTGEPVGAGTLFQIGSITKIYTATLIMQLVESGQLALEDRLMSHLPEFNAPDQAAARRITIRQLLNHSSGLAGDHVPDTGRGDDCLRAFLSACDELEQDFPPGSFYSYCNSGFVLLGAVIERLTGTTWDAAVAQRIVEPLGLHHTVTLPEEALLHSTAVGHFPDGPEGWQQPPVWSVHRSAGPAGTICATPADLVAFARTHVTGTSPAIRLMQERQLDIPESLTGEGCGLGWHLPSTTGGRVLAHSGGNMGQGGLLRVAPDDDFVVAILVNGCRSNSLLEDLLDTLFLDRRGIAPAAPSASIDGCLDPGLFVGTYQGPRTRLRVELDGGRLSARLSDETSTPLVFHGGNRFSGTFDNQERIVAFSGVDAVAAFAHIDGRALPRLVAVA